MATQAWSSPMRHDSDARFRAWADEFYLYATTVGLVQTSDTGQLAYPVTAARPSAGNSAGYWIFRFSDTLQSSAPIFLKVEPGSAATTAARLLISVGTGTDGAGNLTGVVSASASILGGATASSGANRTSRMCFVEGFFGVQWKVAAGTAGGGGFFLQRTCNGSGVPTAAGAYVLWQGSGSSTAAATQVSGFDFSAGYVISETTPGGTRSTVVPCGMLLSTTSSGDLQAFQMFGANRKVFPCFATCAVLTAEGIDGTTLSVAMVGSTARTYITGGNVVCGNPDGAGVCYIAMLWE